MGSKTAGEVWTRASARIREKLRGDVGAQKRLAYQADITEPTLSRFLDAKTEPSFDEALRIADALGWSVSDLRDEHRAIAELAVPYGQASSNPEVFAAPLLVMNVGAGRATLRLFPGLERPYYFRKDWLKSKGWTESDPDRFGVYRLGDETVARSMEPTIAPESVLLVDRNADRAHLVPRSIWIVNLQERLAAKRVTALDTALVLESDNREPDPDFAPLMIPATLQARTRLLEGQVIWYATEVA